MSETADYLRYAKAPKATQRREFIRLASANPINQQIWQRIPDLPLPQGMLVSGCLYQTVWNGLLGHEQTRGIRDYDLAYFDDSDLSYEAEDTVIKECAAAFADLGVEVEVRNQARVHLWFESHFGFTYAPLENAVDSLSRYMCPCHAVAIEPDGAGELALHAPYGLDDVFGFVVRPRPGQDGISAASYRKKATRMKQIWPELKIQRLQD